MKKEENDMNVLIKNRILESEAQAPMDFDLDAEWKAIIPMVKKMNFLQWGFTHFNIYYGLIILLIGTSVLFFSTQKSTMADKTHSITKSTGPIVQMNNSAPSPELNDELISDGIQKEEKAQINQKSKFMALDRDENKKDADIADLILEEEITYNQIEPAEGNKWAEEIKRDSILPEAVKEKTEPLVTPKVKKVVVLNRQDTIFKIDTVHKVKKKRIFH